MVSSARPGPSSPSSPTARSPKGWVTLNRLDHWGEGGDTWRSLVANLLISPSLPCPLPTAPPSPSPAARLPVVPNSITLLPPPTHILITNLPTVWRRRGGQSHNVAGFLAFPSPSPFPLLFQAHHGPTECPGQAPGHVHGWHNRPFLVVHRWDNLG